MAHSTSQTPGFAWDDIYSGTTDDHAQPDELVLKLIQALAPGRALDVGCGAGGLVLALAQAGWDASGVDIAPKAVTAARALFAQHDVSAHVVQGDTTTWQPNGTFNLITCCFALPDTRQGQRVALTMMTASLAPGGTLIVKDFDSTMRRFKHFAGFHLPTIEELIEATTGLEVTRAEVVKTPAHQHSPEGDEANDWSAALLVARRPNRD